MEEGTKKLKILERIRKLFALGENNPSEEEANSALLMAQRLLVKHSIGEDELGLDDPTPIEEKVEENKVKVGQRKAFWQRKLASVIARNFRCKVYYYPGTVVFVGMTVDVAICKEVYNAAIEFCNKFCEAFLVMKTFTDGKMDKTEARKVASDFRLGFVDGLASNFKKQVEENNWQMVLVTPEAVVKYYDNLSLRSGPSSNTHNWGNKDAFSSGKATGEKFASRYGNKGKNRGPKLLKG